MASRPSFSTALVEVWNLTSAVFIADAMVKAAAVQLAGLEINHLGAMIIKVTGETGSVQSAHDVGREWADRLDVTVGSTVIPAFNGDADWLIHCRPQVLGLLRSRAQILPDQCDPTTDPPSLGMVETAGFVPAVAAADEMLKAADVELVTQEKIGAARVSMLVAGSVAAVEASVEAGTRTAETFSALRAHHIIPRPDTTVMKLFPRPGRT